MGVGVGRLEHRQNKNIEVGIEMFVRGNARGKEGTRGRGRGRCPEGEKNWG